MICQSLKHSPDPRTGLLLLPHPQPCQLWRQNSYASIAMARPGRDSGVLLSPQLSCPAGWQPELWGNGKRINALPSLCCRAFFSFSTPPLLYIPMPALLTISEVCAESSECKAQGKQWEGQVRTEKGERKRSVTQAQSDGSRLSCSAVCPQRAISTRQQFTHLGTTTPSTAHAFPPPSWGLRQGRGEGGRDTAPGCQHHFQDKRGRKKPLSSPFQQPPSLWTLSISDEGTCCSKAGGESREKRGILSFGVQGRSALGKCTDTLVLET